jgi:hypothetical protein
VLTYFNPVRGRKCTCAFLVDPTRTVVSDGPVLHVCHFAGHCVSPYIPVYISLYTRCATPPRPTIQENKIGAGRTYSRETVERFVLPGFPDPPSLDRRIIFDPFECSPKTKVRHEFPCSISSPTNNLKPNEKIP